MIDQASSLRSLDLRSVPVYVLWANLDSPEYVSQRRTQKEALTAAGFTSINTVIEILDPLNAATSCAMGHALLIETALTDLQPFQPFLILEDHAMPEGNVEDWNLHFPATADALYPSMSQNSADLKAYEYVHTFNSTYVSQATSDLPGGNVVRIYNMLTAHACLVLSLPWALNWLRCAIEAATRKRCFDVLTAYTMKQYQVYAQPKPWFYQAEIIGGNELETRLVLKGVSISGPDEVPDARMECVSSQIVKDRPRIYPPPTPTLERRFSQQAPVRARILG